MTDSPPDPPSAPRSPGPSGLQRLWREDGAAALVWSLPLGPGGAEPDPERLRALQADPPAGLLPLSGLERDGRVRRLVMADAPGPPLDRILALRRLSPAEALDVAIAAAEALHGLHAAGLVHGRLGPAALFLPGADAGPRRGAEAPDAPAARLALPPDALAADAEDGPRLETREASELAGLAPEQTGRAARRVDARADLYALGALLHLLFSGRPPFASADRLELVHQHLAVPPPPLDAAPAPVAAIAARLLAKAPEERYQTAFGLLCDLRRCRAALADGAAPEPFELGAQDRLAAHGGPDRLYGRAPHLARLRDALDRARAGTGGLVLVGGVSGAGKSSLISAFLEEAREAGALPLTGRHDQLRALPYGALQEALRGYVRALEAGPPEALEAWRDRLRARLGEGAGALAGLLPEIARVLDLPPQPVSDDAAERDQRLRLAAQGLFATLATPERPVVLFLDDMQWADASSLALLRDVLEAVDLPHLLIGLAFREDEVGEGHPLRRMTDALADRGLAPETLRVGPLSEAEALELVADSLGATPDAVGDLAEAVRAKSQGNPFHLRQLLVALHEEGAIVPDLGTGRWRWDIAQVRGRVVDADIARLMAAKVDRLGAEARETLRLAACFGAEFAEADLALLDAREPAARRRGLEEARAAGLIRPTGGEDGTAAARHAFSHDRVLEAAYAQLAPEARRAAHLRLGARLLDTLAEPGEDERLFAALDHLARAGDGVRDPTLGRRMTAAALTAVRRAKRVAAYDLARRWLDAVAALPPEVSGAGWEEAPDTAARLETERLEMAFLLDGWPAARPFFDTLMARLTDDREKARLHELLVTLHTLRADYPAAIEHGVAGLRLLGVEVGRPYGPRIARLLAASQLRGRGEAAEDFSHLPRMNDPAREQAMQMLLILSTPAFLEDKNLFLLVALRMFHTTLRHGLTDAGLASISYFALVSYIGFGAVDRAWRMKRNLFRLFDAVGVSDLVRGRVTYTYAMTVGWYKEPHADLLRRLEDSADYSWRAADLEYVGHYRFGILKYLFVMGRPLEELRARLADADRLRRRIRQDILGGLVATYERFIDRAAGPPDAPLWGEAEAALEARLSGEVNLGAFYQAWLLLALLHDDLDLAAQVYRKLLPYENFTIMGPDYPDYHLCGLILHARAGDRLPADLARRAARRRRRHARALARLGERFPVNHRPHAAFAEAEAALSRAGPSAALPAYRRAADLAAGAGLSHYVALAAERGAAAAEAAGLSAEAAAFLGRARDACLAWGAARRAAELARARPDLFSPAPAAAEGAESLDLDTLVKASAAIFERLDYDALLLRLATLAMENAGADRGAVITADPDGPRLAVEGRVADGRLEVAAAPGAPPLSEVDPESLPLSAIRRAIETAAPLSLDADPEVFEATRHWRAARPRSALCLPVQRGGEVEAVIYLENSMTAGLLTPARHAILGTLASLAAISLANARLYSQQEEALALERRASAELARVNDLKDEFLANTSHELRTPLNGIIGLADSMIAREGDSLSDKGAETLRLIVSSGRRLSGLVNEILDVSLLQHGDVTLDARPVDLRAAAEVVRALLEPRAREGEVRLVNAVPDDLPPALADEDRLQQILLNLAENGVKFAAGGEVTVSAARDGDRLRVEVADDGPGIAPEDRERVFRSFEQADGGVRRQHGGAGLGLAIARRLAELHGGALSLAETSGPGARFVFDLPLAEPASGPVPETGAGLSGEPPEPGFAERPAPGIAAPAPPRPAEPPAPAPAAPLAPLARPDLAPPPPAAAAVPASGPRRRLALAVDDDPVNLRVLENYLELDGYDTVIAADGPEALKKLSEGLEPDVVLLDVMMPRLSGYEVAREIRARNSANRLPIIMLTAKDRVEDLQAAFQCGANDYLAKPFSREELLARMRTHVELAHINVAYERFVPVEFLRFLDRRSIIDIELGDSVEREMTVMFSDMRLFTSLSERMAPHESFDFVSSYFRRLGPYVQENSGVLNQFLGDGMMALFPGDPRDAVKAAVEIQQELERYNADRGSRGEPPVHTGIGMHVGDLVLGIIGDRYRRAGNVVSDAVNLASRVEGLTGRYGVRIAATRATVARLPDPEAFPHRAIDLVRVKGRGDPVEVAEIFAGDPPARIEAKLATLPLFSASVEALRAGDAAEARAALSEILRRDPDDSVARVLLRNAELRHAADADAGA